MSAENIKAAVREKYGQAALRVHSGSDSCCGASAAFDACCDPITRISTTRIRRTKFLKRR